MFSRRTPGSLSPNRLSLRLAERRRAGARLLDVTITNPTGVGLGAACPLDALTDPLSARYDPDPAGLAQAREAVAGYYRDRGHPVDPESLILTASTSEAYAHLFRLLGDAGDEFLAPVPSYPLFEPLAALECVTLAHYPLRFDGRWWLDVDGLRRAVSPRTRGLICVNPNNPTGSALNGAEADAVQDIAAAQCFPLIVDEVFADHYRKPGEDAGGWTFAGRTLTFVLSGLSKICGLPQMKLAWIAVLGPEVERRTALARLEHVADAFLSVSGPVQRAAARFLETRHDFREAVGRRIQANESSLADVFPPGGPVDVLPAQAGWSAVLRVPRVRSEEEWCLELLERDVVIHPGHFYDFPEEAYLIVSLIPDPGEFRLAMERLGELASRASWPPRPS